MSYFVFLLLACFVVGLVGVASNPSPFYGAGALLFGALGGCGVLVVWGGSFIGLVLFLVYLGGMLVVFAYSVALAAEPCPETWGDWSVFVYVLGYFGLLLCGGAWWLMSGGSYLSGVTGVDSSGLFSLRGDISGVLLLYFCGGVFLLLCGWGLMLVLFVVLELTRGRACGGVRLP